MNIYAISLVKNEVDIIGYSLLEASKWANKIFVYDNGSTDGTWETVQEIAKVNNKIIAWKSDGKPYSNGLRAEVFNEFRHIAEEGDWWCFILDADEIYIDDPISFLKKVPKIYHVVKTEAFEYKLTFEDVELYQFNNHFPEDIDKIKYYNPRAYSEMRFFRHRKRLVWNEDNKFPERIGVIYPKRIRLKHYQYRSPEQVKRRVETRKQARKDGSNSFGRDNVDSWKAKLLPRADLMLETPRFERERIFDPNLVPWYWHYFRMVMHFLKIYP